jgi:sulfite reductase alpha subunit-like flavoprotein
VQVQPECIGVCLTVLEYNTATSRLVKGVATNWLNRIRRDFHRTALATYIVRGRWREPAYPYSHRVCVCVREREWEMQTELCSAR